MIPSVSPPPAAPGHWFVYVLWSDTLARTYVGLAVDVSRRVRQHGGELAGGARTTRAGRPWCLAGWYGPFPDRGGATRAERAVKALKGPARLRWVADVGG
ncbi:MAG: GIY-YIG nuclease family protein [Pseudomonadota bacterium]|nr:GIY-YIG nuclease family protein [Pseudomonadota bacterium]